MMIKVRGRHPVAARRRVVIEQIASSRRICVAS